MSDFYALLGVERDASAEQIESAYKEGARKYHPDSLQNQDGKDKEAFKLLSEAHGILTDPGTPSDPFT